MKRISNYLTALVLACGVTAVQAVTIDFDTLTDGDIPGSEFPGVAFEGGQVIDTSIPGSNPLFPSLSGNNVLYDYLDGVIKAVAVGTWTMAGGYITSGYEIFLKAYDSGGNLLATTSTGGETLSNPNQYISVSAADIAYVVFHDSGNTFTLDDFTFEPTTGGTNPVPDAGSTSLLVASALCGLGLLRRKLRVS